MESVRRNQIKEFRFKFIDYLLLFISAIQLVASIMTFSLYKSIMYIFLSYPYDIIIDIAIFVTVAIYLLKCIFWNQSPWGGVRRLLLFLFIANGLVQLGKIIWAMYHYVPI